MEWTDHAIVLSAKPHGERAAIASLLTLHHGRWLGRVNSAQSGAVKAWLSPCALVQASWHARLDEQLGTLRLELQQHSMAHVFENRAALLAFDYLAALADRIAPERLPLPLLFGALDQAIKTVLADQPLAAVSLAAVAQFERAALDAMGYGLDLSACAVTGMREHLTAISPSSGRAVSAAAAAPYGNKLLPLPAFWLVPQAAGQSPDVRALSESLQVTGHFLKAHFYQAPHDLPPARAQLLSVAAAAANVSAA